jgi:AraC family transcriptional regulator, regulatory protein of adaptative response / methylated-DNA-[protein]-cysteine methyltransferase
MNTNIDDRRWNAVVAREDGRFFYAVRTTGIYCRPSCPSRRPHRQNVVFFPTAEEARSAGFRACLRCIDRDADSRIEKLCRMLDAAEERPTLVALAEACGLSRFHTLREFKRVVGMTPAAYYRWRRARRLSQSLSAGERVDDAIYAAGFGSPSRVYERTDELLGMTPAKLRKGAPGEKLRYGFAETPFGLMVVAASSRGICAIEFGANRKALVESLRQRFPKATLAADFGTWIDEVARHVSEPSKALGLPLDLQGTVFQKKVWDALKQIAAGDTVSYTELARRLGCPEAVRAVASACARNPAAVAVPCHRVVGSDGALRGYRWGIERKRALLENEKKLKR